jgi:hypothetical protein
MLKEHKLRQSIFLKLVGPDNKKGKEVKILEESGVDLIKRIVAYFKYPSDDLVYPAKSYSVALIYASLLEEYFEISLLDSLADLNLFQGTDRFFKSYDLDKAVYDSALRLLTEEGLLRSLRTELPQIKETVRCFHEEFFTSCPDLGQLEGELTQLLST